MGGDDVLRRLADRNVFGMADDPDHLVLVAFQRFADFFQDRFAGVLEVRAAGIEEQLLGDVDRQHVLVLPHLQLALLDLLGVVAHQRVVLRFVLLAGGQQLRLLLLQRVDLRAQLRLLLLERRLLRLQALHLLLEPAALLLQRCDLLVLVRLELVVGALADAAAQREHPGERGARSVQSPSVHFHLLVQSDDSPGSIQYNTAIEKTEEARMKGIESLLAMPAAALAVFLAACAATPPGPTASVKAELAPTGPRRGRVFTGNPALGTLDKAAGQVAARV